jgi:hypothetical protein
MFDDNLFLLFWIVGNLFCYELTFRFLKAKHVKWKNYWTMGHLRKSTFFCASYGMWIKSSNNHGSSSRLSWSKSFDTVSSEVVFDSQNTPCFTFILFLSFSLSFSLSLSLCQCLPFLFVFWRWFVILQKLLAHGYIRGTTPFFEKPGEKLIAVVINCIANCFDAPDDNVQLQILKVIFLQKHQTLYFIYYDSVLWFVNDLWLLVNIWHDCELMMTGILDSSYNTNMWHSRNQFDEFYSHVL